MLRRKITQDMQSKTKSVFHTACSWTACLGRWHLSADHRVELEMTPQSILGRCPRCAEWEGRAAACWAVGLCAPGGHPGLST